MSSAWMCEDFSLLAMERRSRAARLKALLFVCFHLKKIKKNAQTLRLQRMTTMDAAKASVDDKHFVKNSQHVHMCMKATSGEARIALEPEVAPSRRHTHESLHFSPASDAFSF